MDVRKDEILNMPSAANHDLAIRVHDVAIPVAHTFGLGDTIAGRV
jgi:hypothetical protein